jgi:hypothetical protein
MSGRIPPSRSSRTEGDTAQTAAAPVLESTGTAPTRLPQALTSVEVAGHATLSAALALRRQAKLHGWVERWDDAHEDLLRSLALLEGGLEPRHPLIAATLYLVAEACRELGDEARAQAFSRRIREVLSDWQPPHGPSRALILGWGLPNRRGRQPEVEVCFWPARHLLESCRRSPSPASDLGLLAQFHHHRGWLGLAEILYWQSLDWGMTELGPHHPQVAADHLNLASLLRSTGRTTEADGIEVLGRLILRERSR